MTITPINLLGFSPDIDPSTPGAITNCQNIIPSIKGMVGGPSAVNATEPALTAQCLGAVVFRKLDNSTRFVAGTTTQLHESVGTAWTSVGSYNANDDAPWRFAQFGDVSLLCNKNDVLQYSTAVGSFTAVATAAPKGGIVETVNQFVFLLDVNDQGSLGPYGDNQNRWWCAAKGTYANWTPSVDTECATGTLTATPGKITAGRRLGDQMVVYKRQSMYLGSYVGPPEVWNFQLVPGEIGALSQEAIVSLETAHIFIGKDDFYVFDGSRPVSLSSPIKEWFFGQLNRPYEHKIRSLHEREMGRIWWAFPSGSSTTLNAIVVYNYRTKKWGCADRNVEAFVEYVSGTITYGDLGSYFSTYGDLTGISYGSSFWTATSEIPCFINDSHRPQTLTGSSSSCGYTTGDFGSDVFEALLRRVRPKYTTKPTTGQMTNYYKAALGDALTTDTTTTESSSRYDLLRTARWHRLKFDYTGDVEFSSLLLDTEEMGFE